MNSLIETQRLLIRTFSTEDAAGLQEILGDAETMEYSEAPYDLEKTEKFLKSFCIDRRGALAAVHRESGKLIGYILFNEYEKSVYEIGWFFNREFWGHGYAYEACGAVIDYAFDKLKAHKVFAETIDTVKSLGLMKKLGMKPEAVLREQTSDNHGNPADMYLYGLSEENWRSGL